jgi:predicted ATPase
MERLAGEPHTRLRYFCSSQHTDSALFPIISQMERAAGFAHDDSAQAKLDKLDGVLAQSFTFREETALFADMLSLPNDGRYPALELAPQQRRQKTLEALTAQVEALSRSNPVLMMFEDVHWIDPTSLEALGRTVDRMKKLGMLLIVTYRPEFEPPWNGRPYVTAISLNRLGEREIVALIDRVTGNKSLPDGVRQDIIERTDGIPLFVEEMTQAVLEAGGDEAGERMVSAIPSPSIAVPASLHASLMARLDRLGSAKEVAQIGAVIGREFSHAVLAAVARKPEPETASALDRLIAAGLLFRQGTPPHAIYLFKHALVQDAAYGTLLREPRRALHARIAETLENQFAETAENRPELLARHFTEARLIEKAAVLWGKAGQRSLERSALVEAVAQLIRALDQIATLSGTRARRREQINLQVALTNALMHVKGHASSDAKASLEKARQYIERAETLGETLEDPLLLFSVLYGFWIANFMAFDGNVLKDLASQFLASAEKQSATAPLMMGHRIMGMCLLYCGDVAEGKAHLNRALLLYDPDKHRQFATRFVVDAGPTILSYRSLALCVLGYPDAALIDADRALSIAKQTGHTATLIVALLFGAMVNMFRGNYALAKLQANELIALSEQSGALFWKQSGMHVQGSIFAMTGKASEAVALISPRITEAEATGTTIGLPRYLTHLARSHAELGQFYDASCCIGRAMATLEKANERWEEAEVYRVAGEIALISSAPDPPQAEAYFERALAVARRQQAKFWELRAALSLARLWRDQGKVRQARELLAPVYGWFTEGFDTRDLKEAKALLEELVPPRGDGAIAQC